MRCQDVAVLGVWQDANTLKKYPVFKTENDIKRTGCSVNVDRSEDDDVQIIKMVPSHCEETSQSGNTSEYFVFLFFFA
jgi:hypothetical protein